MKGYGIASQGVRVCEKIRGRTGPWMFWRRVMVRGFGTGSWMVPGHGVGFEREKGIRWMPWHQEAMKDVARCEKPRGAASRL